MKKTVLAGSLVCLLPLLAVLASRADDSAITNAADDRTVAQAEPADAPATREPAARPPRRESRGRLPNYYRQVGVSEEQRGRIYGIQSNYQERIAAIEQQLRELTEQRDKEVEAVLTAEQRTELQKLEAEAAARRAEAAERRRAEAGARPRPESATPVEP
ncbi:MAG: hypothetical protein WD066_18585 [Planctomycetaceae bacterium]